MSAARWLLLSFVLALRAFAHPVAQGSVELRAQPGVVEARFRISNEQVFVASTFGGGGAVPANLDELFRSHARSILAHVVIEADGVVLRGSIAGVEPPADRTVKGFAVYELRSPLPAPVHWPASVFAAPLIVTLNDVSVVASQPAARNAASRACGPDCPRYGAICTRT